MLEKKRTKYMCEEAAAVHQSSLSVFSTNESAEREACAAKIRFSPGPVRGRSEGHIEATPFLFSQLYQISQL